MGFRQRSCFIRMFSRMVTSVSVIVVAGCMAAMGSAASAGSTGDAVAAPGDSPIAWTTFQDPFEQAFNVEVPQGWKVRGGLFRMGFSDERPMVDVLSPDGRINVRLGDVSIPTYTMPTANHSREGQPYDLGAQAQLVVA